VKEFAVVNGDFTQGIYCRRNEVSRFFWIPILSLSIGSSTTLSFASDLTKLAPEPLVVHLQNGAGSEKVIFAKGSGISV
jgi:hypothetical protein